jgi:hypothetical protein
MLRETNENLIESEEFCLLGYNVVYLLKVNRRLGGTCRLHLQGPRIRQGKDKYEIRWQTEQA